MTNNNQKTTHERLEEFVSNIVTAFNSSNKTQYKLSIDLPVVNLEAGNLEIIPIIYDQAYHIKFGFLYGISIGDKWSWVDLSNVKSALNGFYKEFLKLGVRFTDSIDNTPVESTWVNRKQINGVLFISNVIKIMTYLTGRFYGIPKSKMFSLCNDIVEQVYTGLTMHGWCEVSKVFESIEYEWKLCSDNNIKIEFYSDDIDLSGLSIGFIEDDDEFNTIYLDNSKPIDDITLNLLYGDFVSIMNEHLIRINPEITFK